MRGRVLGSILIGLLAAAPACPGQTNFLLNSSFEVQYPGNTAIATNWYYGGGWTHGSNWGSAARRNWWSHSGSWAGAVQGAWSGTDYGGYWQECPAVAGSSYVASAWFWADVPGTYAGGPWTAAVKKFTLDFYSTNYTLLQSSTTLLNGIVEQWTQLSVTATAPVSAEWARVVFWVEGMSSYGALEIDDAELAFSSSTPSNPPPEPSLVGRFVSKSGSHTPPYTNWAMAATDLVSACSAATSGEVVYVTNGTYDTGGQAYAGESLSNRVVVPAWVTMTSVNGPDTTTIAGQGSIGPGAMRCVRLGSRARLSGFTIVFGHTLDTGSPSQPDYSGAGVLLEAGSVVSNCIIVGNDAYQDGGGTYVGESQFAEIRNCRIHHNSARYGGGAYFYTFGTIANCVVDANYASISGGGIYTDHGTADNCLVVSNRAFGRGGGMYFGSQGYARHCTVASNEVNLSSGAGGIDAFSYAYIQNCILYWNSSPSATNENWISTQPVYFYNCCTLRTNGMTACITNEPRFVDRDLGNFKLGQSSPCIDQGTALSVSNDILGRVRPIDGDQNGTTNSDIGAYEYDQEYDDSDEDGYTDQDEGRLGTEPTNGASHFTLLPAYSGGSNGTNIIRFGPSVTGRLYTLEYRDDLLTGIWTNLGGSQQDVPGIGSNLDAILDFRTESSRYYRVRVRTP